MPKSWHTPKAGVSTREEASVTEHVSPSPDPELDAAHAHLDRVARHVKHGRVILLIELDEWLVTGHEVAYGHTIASDIARLMSQTPRRR